MRLMNTFIADIPLHKTSNPVLKEFLESTSTMKVHERSTLQRNYVPSVYDSVIAKNREEIGNAKTRVSIDETIDRSRRQVANVAVGELEIDQSFVSQSPYIV